MKWVFVSITFVFLAGCGTTAAVREFQTYALAFDAVQEASDAVLTEIAASERKSRIDLIDNDKTGGISDELKPANIAIFAPNADPKFVGSMRFAVNSVAQFNDVMLAYAEGRALGILGSEISSLRSAGVGFETPAKDSGTAVTDISKSIKGLNIALELLAGVGSREAFRTQLKASGQELDAVLAVLIKHSDVAFKLLTGDDFGDLRIAVQIDKSAVSEIRDKIAKDREMLAEWLYLIQLSRAALAEALAAIGAPQSSSARLVEAAVIAGDLRARAERIKRLAIED